ncbi:HNH endonuclease [Pseudomonas sp. TUM22785]|uniref:HNH endonuclease n=1 Tax=Pseudomonas sp. TUM22785 TaxID=3019098 RepID=UPI002304F650|nr:hypothetical protein [Pseudomonas sp. TUM22785]WCD82966.1 hypothetical protein PI990_13355 [Pseudomonas sp. TUM22785]
MLELFKDREAEYLEWIESNPVSYVAEIDQAHSSPHYPLVHHASCESIVGEKIATTGDNYKVCAARLEDLEQWSLQKLGRPVRFCVLCSPIRWTGFWWVNHKQTAKVELKEGYIWSPETKKGGVRNQAYTNLKLVRPGDIIVSYAGGIKAIGVATAHYSNAKKPEGYGPAGESWNDFGLRVPVEWTFLDAPIKPKDHIAEIAPLLPDRYSPLQLSGDGNQGFYLSCISSELGSLILRLAGAQESVVRSIAERASSKAPSRLPIAVLRRVTALHVWEAVRDLLAGTVAIEDFGPPIKYELVTEDGQRLPPKAVFGLAATRALGFPIKPKHFTAGIGSPCFQILIEAGFPIVSLGESTSPEPYLLPEEQLWAEGNKKLVAHLRGERAPGLSKAKKAKFREVHGELFCERCKMKPVDVYGDEGDACIEVHHHTTQVADMAPGHKTSLEDLQCLCANCHRVVHRLLKRSLLSA